jgi:hypothetical protein
MKTDWLAGTDSRQRAVALGLILAAGFLLRVFNLQAGIPPSASTSRRS